MKFCCPQVDQGAHLRASGAEAPRGGRDRVEGTEDSCYGVPQWLRSGISLSHSGKVSACERGQQRWSVGARSFRHHLLGPPGVSNRGGSGDVLCWGVACARVGGPHAAIGLSPFRWAYQRSVRAHLQFSTKQLWAAVSFAGCRSRLAARIPGPSSGTQAAARRS